MSKKRKRIEPVVSGWTPLQLSYPAHNEEYAALYPDQYAQDRRRWVDGSTTMWVNNRYVVIKEELNDGLTWLSIRHTNRKPIRDWRHFQRIKNELCGTDREAVEIYPAESRLTDEANQYHLWVLPEGEVVPFGFPTRNVSDDIVVGPAKQRPLDKEIHDDGDDDV